MSQTCVSCLGGDCLDLLGNRSPFVEYNLNEGQMFLQNETFCFTLGCPDGFICSGPYPRVICIPPRTLPPIVYGPSGRVSINCCNRPLYATVPPTTNQTQLNQIIFNLQQECARQEANCINHRTGPGGFPPPRPGGPPARLCPSIVNLATLPVAVEGRAYNYQLIAAGGTPPYRFLLDSGGFPSALSLTSDGTILGTPEYLTAGSYPLTLRVADVFGRTCALQDVTLIVEPAPGPAWQDLVWDTYTLNQGGGAPNSAAGSAAGRIATGNIIYASQINPFPGIAPVHASIPAGYTGPQVTCRMQLTESFSGTPGLGVSSAMIISRNAVQLGGIGCTNSSGIFTQDIVIPLSVGATIEVSDAFPGNDWAQLNQILQSGTMSFSLAIFNL